MISEVSDNEPDLTKNAQEVLNRRYLLHNEKGDVVETDTEFGPESEVEFNFTG